VWSWSQRRRGSGIARTGGVEDPRITFVGALDCYVMAYAAYGPLGPRLALAVSDDLENWERLGPVTYRYAPELAADLNLYPNKDAFLFPEPVPGPAGQPALALVHRPMWDLSWIREGEGAPLPRGVTDPRPGIWVSYVSLASARAEVSALTHVTGHRCVAMAEHPWEASKIGGVPLPCEPPTGGARCITA
jgi:beta-1,2-mannobiose phosphorylase / 1,2-beta-oligomannan phosphorylase